MARLRRLFVPELPAAGGVVVLPRAGFEHVLVLRLAVGAELNLFDAQGREAQASISRITRELVECFAQPPSAAAAVSGGLQLLVCLPKAAKLETIVRMATELGVRALHLCESERSVPKLAPDSAKLERLRRVAREACAQSGQPLAPELTGPSPLLARAGAAPRHAHKLLFWEQASAPLPAAFGGTERGAAGANAPPEVWAVVGPEGGLSGAEAELLSRQAYVPVRLGPHILRAETACVVIATLLLDRLGALAPRTP